MAQRIFDTDNEKDMADLWNILPDDIIKLTPSKAFNYFYGWWNDCGNTTINMLKINWHDKTEIERPIEEATETDIGKLCKFALEEPTHNINGGFGILTKIGKDENGQNLYLKDIEMWYNSCRRLTQREIKELC